MSQFSKVIDNMNSFVLGNQEYRYIGQVIIENYTKMRNWESKLNTRLRRILNTLDVNYTISTPYTRATPATYVTCEENGMHVDVIRLLDQIRFEDTHLTAKPYIFTKQAYNLFPLHADYSKETQRVAVQRFNENYYPQVGMK